MSTPTPPPTVVLANQVGGHAGVQTTEDESLLIKPALPLEHQFYQSVATSPDLEALQPYIPKFLGTLKLEGRKTAEGEVVAAPDDKDTFPSLVLENLSHAFFKPNILDVKLGTVLYDEDASEEKRERMEKTARETTSYGTGIRLTGFQVYDNATSLPITTPKSYGKSVTAAELPEGVARFFPVAPSSLSSSDEPNLGLPARLLLPILTAVKEEIEEIGEALSGIELRMVGGSLLVLYEADWTRVEEGFKWLEERAEVGEEEEEEDEEEDDEEEGEGKKKPGPPFVVKLIDFAHTRLKPGEGPDEGVLKGIETFLRLLEGRIEEVEKAVEASEP